MNNRRDVVYLFAYGGGPITAVLVCIATIAMDSSLVALGAFLNSVMLELFGFGAMLMFSLYRSSSNKTTGIPVFFDSPQDLADELKRRFGVEAR